MKNNAWIFYSIAAALFWGVWGVVAKLISEDVSPYANHVLFTIGMLFTLPLVLKKLRQERPNRKGIYWGLISGILAIAGNVAVFQAFSSGGLAAIVIPLTNLYPLVTIVIAILVFKEKLNGLNALGILLAIPAVVMLSGQTLLFDDPAAFRQKYWTQHLAAVFLGGPVFLGGVQRRAKGDHQLHISGMGLCGLHCIQCFFSLGFYGHWPGGFAVFHPHLAARFIGWNAQWLGRAVQFCRLQSRWKSLQSNDHCRGFATRIHHRIGHCFFVRKYLIG